MDPTAAEQVDDDEAQTPAPAITVLDCVAVFFASFVTAAVGFGIGSAFGDDDSLAVTAGGLIGLWCGMVPGAIILSRARGSGSLVRDYGLRFARRDWIGIPVALGSQFVILPLIYVVMTLVSDRDLLEEIQEPAKELTEQASPGLAFGFLALLLIVGAPIVEEIFYRGMFFGALRRRWSVGVSIVVSGLVFGLVHFEPLLHPGAGRLRHGARVAAGPNRHAGRGDRRARDLQRDHRGQPCREHRRARAELTGEQNGDDGTRPGAAPRALRALGPCRHHRRHRRRGAVHVRAAAPVASVHRHDPRRWRHGCPCVDTGVPARPPPAPRAPHGLDQRLVRGVPGAHLLLPTAEPDDRAGRSGDPVQRRVQARHGLRAACAARGCVVLRAHVAPALPRSRDSRRRHGAIPVRQDVHHLRREHRLDAGRGVLVLDQPRGRIRVSRAVRPRPRDRRAPCGCGGGSGRYWPMPRRARVLCDRRRNRPRAHATEPAQPQVRDAGVPGVRAPRRVLGYPVHVPDRLHERHGMGEARDIPRQPVPAVGAHRARLGVPRAGPRHRPSQPHGVVPVRHVRHLCGRIRRRAPEPAVERPPAAVLVPEPRAARRVRVLGGGDGGLRSARLAAATRAVLTG